MAKEDNTCSLPRLAVVLLFHVVFLMMRNNRTSFCFVPRDVMLSNDSGIPIPDCQTKRRDEEVVYTMNRLGALNVTNSGDNTGFNSTGTR